jgi:predicted Rossmann-fold nucleotide-binding protein
MGSARNRIVALSGEAVVAVGGRYGTLSEVAFALDAGRPVCTIGGWGSVAGVTEVDGPEEALEFVMGNVDRGGDA